MKTADPELMRAINRFHVMDAIRRRGPISRIELAALTDLSPATISAITAALLDDKLIIPRRFGALGDAARGRPRVMLELNRAAALVAGIHVGRRGVVLVLTDFQGEPLARHVAPFDGGGPATSKRLAEVVRHGLDALCDGADVPAEALAQVCVALPGTVEHTSGLVRRSPILEAPDIDLGAALATRLPCPVIVESEANAALVGEAWFRLCRDLEDFAVLVLGGSLGFGLMHGGEVFRGARGLSFDLDALLAASAGQGLNARGSLSRHLEEDATPTGPLDEDGPLATRPRPAVLDAPALEAVAGLVATVATLLSPPRIVVAVRDRNVGGADTGALEAALAARMPGWLAGVCETRLDHLDETAIARGAAGAALRALYGAPWGTTGPARRSVPAEAGVRA